MDVSLFLELGEVLALFRKIHRLASCELGMLEKNSLEKHVSRCELEAV